MDFAVQKYLEWCLDWVLPRYCYGCGLEGCWCCDKCKKDNFLIIEKQVCPDCRKISKCGSLCNNCHSKWNLDALVVCCAKSKWLANLVADYKYEDIYKLDEVLADIYVAVVKNCEIGVDLISYVPLERKRQWWRGFNQSERLARIISRKINIPVVTILDRKKFYRRQVGLSKSERLKNVSGMFEFTKNIEKYVGKNVLIVDDVCTTMATLEECAKVLKSAGISKVTGIVIARGL